MRKTSAKVSRTGMCRGSFVTDARRGHTHLPARFHQSGAFNHPSLRRAGRDSGQQAHSPSSGLYLFRPASGLSASSTQRDPGADFSTVSIPTGGGKTVLALEAIAQRKQPALIVVHSNPLMNQWIEHIGTFLGILADDIGVIGGGKNRIGEKITVALVQSLYKSSGEVAPHFGHLIIDECHRAPAWMFTEAITAFDCRYQLGLSATPYRRDKLNRLNILACRKRSIIKSTRKDLIESHDILPAEVITRETTFQPTVDPSAAVFGNVDGTDGRLHPEHADSGGCGRSGPERRRRVPRALRPQNPLRDLEGNAFRDGNRGGTLHRRSE